SVRGDEIKFKFSGKSGVEAELSISNPTIAKTIKKCIELPGYVLFQFIDDEGEKRVVDSEDVNAFLKDITKDDFTAKDFRTWGATDLSANFFYKIGHSDDPKVIKKNIKDAIKQVSIHLNNTVTVCRSYYIHPTVIETYEKKVLVPHFETRAGRKSKISGLSWDEDALIELLRKYPL
ncbi:MAG: DNA topoisomerase IB, partial [Candidatus Levybacteria bacterium]|nr:DNA topoisomerase IB [Candidatus Levybacteria bacterium]